MKIMEQANRLMQRAQALYEENKDIMKPQDREEAKDKMSKWVEVSNQAPVFQILKRLSPQRQGS